MNEKSYSSDKQLTTAAKNFNKIWEKRDIARKTYEGKFIYIDKEMYMIYGIYDYIETLNSGYKINQDRVCVKIVYAVEPSTHYIKNEFYVYLPIVNNELQIPVFNTFEEAILYAECHS